MLTSIQIANFKAFADTQRIPLRPLTLIYGANSSGKSSIIHSLILARHALETGNLDIHLTTVGGDAVDLGGFRQYIHRRDTNLRMEWSAELDTANLQGRLAELLAPVKYIQLTLEIGLPQIEEMKEQEGIDPRTGEKIVMKVPTGNLIPAGEPEVMSYTLASRKDILLQMSKRKDGKLQLDRLEHDHPIFREVLKAIVETSTTAESIQPSDYEGLEEAIAEIVPYIIAKVDKFLPEGLARSEAFTHNTQLTFFSVSRGRRREDLAAAVRFFIPRTLDELIGGIGQAVATELKRLQYLGPLRSYPPRHLAFSQHHDPNWFAGGGYAWDVLRQDGEIRSIINTWLTAPDRLQTPYEIVLREFLDAEDLLEKLEEIYEDFAKEASLGVDNEFWNKAGIKDLANNALKDAPHNILTDLFLVDRRSNTIVSHRDVGIGISQVLPVLVGAYASKNQIITIEQPEIHLHPALQADLGDVFIQSALGKNRNRFLIETHSEHLLLRVMRRMRETFNDQLPKDIPPIHPEDVCVLFVQPKGSASVVRHLELDEEGHLLDPWPGGFFEEGFRERFM